MKLAAQLVASFAAACSLVFVLVAGSKAPVVLLVVFTLWNFVPYSGLALSNFQHTRPSSARTLYLGSIIAGTLASAAYVYFWMYPREHQPAAPYLVIPVLGWMAFAAFLIF